MSLKILPLQKEKDYFKGEVNMTKKILLYSGGLDSWLISRLWNPDIKLYVDMQSKYSEKEIDNLKNNKEDFELIKFPLGQWERDDAIIPLRNLYLIMVACNHTNSEDIEICIGATHGDRSLDQSLKFAKDAENLMNYLYAPQHWIPNGKKVNVVMPYKDYTKTELLKEFIEKGGDIDEAFKQSFSCYTPINGEPCWECKPCWRKVISFMLNGYKFDKEVKNKVRRIIEKEIEPEIIAGNYGRGKEDQEILDALKLLREE